MMRGVMVMRGRRMTLGVVGVRRRRWGE